MIDSGTKAESRQKYIQCITEYAEVVMQLDDAVLRGCSGEEVMDLVGRGIEERSVLKNFNLKNQGLFLKRLIGMVPRFLERRELVEEYKRLIQDPLRIKDKFEVEINSRNPRLPAIQLAKPKACIYHPDTPYALGIVVGKEEMQKIAAKLEGREFQGLHLGRGLMVILAEGEIEGGKISPQMERKISDVLAHENFHALVEIMGAGGSRDLLRELEDRIYSQPVEGEQKVTAQDIRSLIDLVLRLAKEELIPEARIDFMVYPGIEPKERFKAAYAFVIGQILHSPKENIARLKIALENPPLWWELGEQEKGVLQKEAASLEGLIIDRIGAFLVTSSRGESVLARRLLFYAATFLPLRDFNLLPSVMEVINQRYPPESSIS